MTWTFNLSHEVTRVKYGYMRIFHRNCPAIVSCLTASSLCDQHNQQTYNTYYNCSLFLILPVSLETLIRIYSVYKYTSARSITKTHAHPFIHPYIHSSVYDRHKLPTANHAALHDNRKPHRGSVMCVGDAHRTAPQTRSRWCMSSIIPSSPTMCFYLCKSAILARKETPTNLRKTCHENRSSSAKVQMRQGRVSTKCTL